MKIILQQTVENLGVPGDVVTVADGYARNYLIPRNLAVPATKGGVKHVESLKRAHEAREDKARTEAEAVAERFRATPLRIAANAGEDGKLFGSVTAADVAAELAKSADFEVDRHKVHLEEPIRSLGVHTVSVHLGTGVEAEVSVEVVAAE